MGDGKTNGKLVSSIENVANSFSDVFFDRRPGRRHCAGIGSQRTLTEHAALFNVNGDDRLGSED